jgi:hypothetical protein
MATPFWYVVNQSRQRQGPARRPLRGRSPTTPPIPGTLSLEHLKENLAALEIDLSDAEFEALR